ncbi:resolvase [Actinokineospora xionganensis]|uniref:resolvase n=1 Tax=Actinokineospora xionganensis TaxID=2684470 RepID=UPI001FE42A66|nr:resolvase [Actinokineospora xionganensis]
MDVLRRINDTDQDGHETATTIEGTTASLDHVREILTEQDVTEVIEAYRSSAMAKALTERNGVHASTIKKKLRKHGVRRATMARHQVSDSLRSFKSSVPSSSIPK